MTRFVCIIATITLYIMCIPAFSVNAQNQSFAIVDVQRIILQSDKGKEVHKELKEEFDRMKKELERRKLSSNAQDYELLRKEFVTKLKDKEHKLIEPILREITETIKIIGAKGKYALIVGKKQGSVIYSDPAIDMTDITEEVLGRYNSVTRQPDAFDMTEIETDVQSIQPAERMNYSQYLQAFSAPDGKTMREWVLTRIAASGHKIVPGCIVEMKDDVKGLITNVRYPLPQGFVLDSATGAASPSGPPNALPGGSIKITYTSKDLDYKYYGFEDEKTTWERIVRKSTKDGGNSSSKAVTKNGIYYLKLKVADVKSRVVDDIDSLEK